MWWWTAIFTLCKFISAPVIYRRLNSSALVNYYSSQLLNAPLDFIGLLNLMHDLIGLLHQLQTFDRFVCHTHAYLLHVCMCCYESNSPSVLVVLLFSSCYVHFYSRSWLVRWCGCQLSQNRCSWCGKRSSDAAHI